jgi:hypothetical protein
MTAKFDAFKAALEALCIEHGVRLYGEGDDDYYAPRLKLATEAEPAGLDVDIQDEVPPTPEEKEAIERERSRQRAFWEANRATEEKRQAEFLRSPAYLAMVKHIGEQAANERKQYMRVSTDPKDPAYIDDRPRKAWCNDVEIEGWTVADEFRRCVITPQKVHNGAVRIERLPDDYTPNFVVVEKPVEPPINAGFSGMFVPDAKPAAPAAKAAPAAAKPKAKATKAKRRR